MAVKERTVNAVATMHAAAIILGLSEGDRLPTIMELGAELEVSRGTVQNVLMEMVRTGAITLETRGHLGTFLTGTDDRALLRQADIHSIYCAMPLPDSGRFEGLAGGLYGEMEKLDVPVGILYLTGSARRLRALMEKRLDFVVMSERAAAGFMRDGAPVEILHSFPEYSYVNSHYLVVRKGFDIGKAPMVRVGVDEFSTDQSYWMNRICPPERVVPIPVQYARVIDHIADGVIDACIWSYEDGYDDSRVQIRKLPNEGEAVGNTVAVLVVRQEDIGVKNYLKRKLSFQKIYETQQAVMRGERLPDY